MSSIQSGASARRPTAWLIFVQSDSDRFPLRTFGGVHPGLGAQEALGELEVAHLQGEEQHRPLLLHCGVGGHAEGEGRLAGAGAGADDRRASWLEARELLVEVGVAGGQAR